MSVLNYSSIVVSGSTVEELEEKINERLKSVNYLITTVSSPSIFNKDDELIALLILSPRR